MTQPTSIFNVQVAHGDKVDGSRRTYTQTLDKSKMSKPGYRVVKDGDSKDGLYFCAADFGGEDRGNAHIQAIRLLIIDVDKSTQDAVRSTVTKLKADNIHFVCYTTASHNPEKLVKDKNTGEDVIRIGYRFILLAPRDYNISEYRHAIDYVARKYDMEIDEASRVPSQAMFYPTVYESNTDHLKFVHYTESKAGEPAGTVSIPEEVMEAAAAEHDIISSSTNLPVLPPHGIDETYYLSTLLDCIDPTTQTYEEWRDTSFAIHHQTFGKGMELWNTWSSRHPKYKPQEMAGKWASFSTDPSTKGITLRKILNWEVARGVTNETRLISRLMKQAETGAVLENLRKHVVEQAQEGFLKGINKNIAEAYVAAKKRLYDIKITISDAQFELRSTDITDERRKFFYNKYVYIMPTSEWFELSTGKIRTGKTMDMKFTRGYGRPDNQGSPKSFTYTMMTYNDYDQCRMANGFVYEPQQPGQLVFKPEGYYINTFKHADWHDIHPQDAFNPERNPIDLRINGILNLHFEILSDSRPEVKKFLMQYIAHLRQKPGTRIHHALCITSSAQGIGKSITQALFEAVLGESNVKGLLKQTMMQPNFNSYVSAEKMVQVIDEFDHLSDRKSAEILTSLKSAITSDHGPVSYKGANDGDNVPYHSVYVLFSNNRNVLNGEGGRRWSQFDIRNMRPTGKQNKAGPELEDLVGRDPEEFWQDYQDLLRDYPDRLAAFFDSVDLEGFSPNKSMLMKRESDSGGYITIEAIVRDTFDEMIEAGHSFVTDEIVKVHSLHRRAASNYVVATGGDEVSNNRLLRKAVVTFLTDKGYNPINGRKRIKGIGGASQLASKAVYTRGNQPDIIAKYNKIDPPNEEDED